jgi:hypothetical protein
MRLISSDRFLKLVYATISFSWIALASVSVTGQSYDEPSFPYQALVLSDGATVHSGPADVHYATDRLKQGALVNVFRHDPDGWCAIQPVKGSFSLIPEAAIEMVQKDIGVIREDGTQAWVGTALGAVESPLWQIKLKEGESVKVLGQVSWPDPQGHSTTWYQVSPPAGEFRWIRMSDIQLPPSRPAIDTVFNQGTTGGNVVSRNQIPSSGNSIHPRSIQGASRIPTIGNDRGVQQASHQSFEPSSRPQPAVQTRPVETRPVDTRPNNSGWRQATRPIDKRHATVNTYAANASRNRSNNGFSDASYSNRGLTGQANPNNNKPVREFNNPNRPDRVASLDISRQRMAADLSNTDSMSIGGLPNQSAAELELQLSKEMVKSNPKDWVLDRLETAGNSLLESRDPAEAAKAKRFLEKISNCKKIRSGFLETESLAGGQPAGAASKISGGTNIELSTRFDAYGWLNQMVRDGGQSQPTYVLQDENGNITHHVAPAPGLNLHRYLKSKVGIVGQRGFHTRYQLDHVTVHRIVELEKPKR